MFRQPDGSWGPWLEQDDGGWVRAVGLFVLRAHPDGRYEVEDYTSGKSVDLKSAMRNAEVALGDLNRESLKQLGDASLPTTPSRPIGYVKPDTDTQVFFYEQDCYPLSNFSAFSLMWKGRLFLTSEAAYHWEKFPADIAARESIRSALSAHEAFKYAEQNKGHVRDDWNSVRVGIMLEILREKARQHEYVRRKLLSTGNKELIEDSWRDPFWGWGPNRDGQNQLGKLWMQVRDELRAAL